MHQASRHIGIIVRQYKLLHFRKYTGHFYACGSSAYNDDIQQFLLFLFG